jgi:hypothetical protein
MPVKSQSPGLSLPETDVFSFFFSRTDRLYPDNQGGNHWYDSNAVVLIDSIQ